MIGCTGVYFDINNKLIQRRRAQLLYTAEPRYDNLKNSPYLIGFNQQQLNMKRKTEILKYASNTQSNQTNNPTKKQQYANLVKGSVSQPSILIKNNTCPNDMYLPSLTSSCDVPGKIIVLQNDPSVPLYLYGFNTDETYSNFQQVLEPTKWTIYDLSENKIFNNSVENLELTLYVQGGIDKSYYNYTINTPLSIYIQGDISLNYTFNKNGNTIIDSSNIEVVLNNIVLNVYYNTSVVYTEKIILNKTTDLSYNLIFDLSGSTNVINKNTFFGSLFIGNLNISNIQLNTTDGTIYDFKITANFYYTTPIYINNLNVGIVSNITNNYTYISNNCNVIGFPSIIQKPFSFNGV